MSLASSVSMEIVDSKDDRKNKRLHKIKTISIAVLVVIIVILAIKIGITSDSPNQQQTEDNNQRPLVPFGDSEKEGVCMSENCILASARLYKNMNLSADPCKDFNEFSCGRFLSEFVLPEDKSSWSSFTPLTDLILEKGRLILEEEDKSDDWPIFKKAKQFFRSCLDEEKIEQMGIEPAVKQLSKIEGWPVLEGDLWQEDGKKDWHDIMGLTSPAGLGKDYIFKLSTETDDKNNTHRSVFLDQPSLGLNREYLIKGFDDKDVQAYFTYMKESAVLLGADPGKAAAELEKSLKFELKLAELSAPREERRNASKLYNPTTLGELESLPGHPPSWKQYAKSIIFNVDLTDDDRIIIKNPAYVKNVSALLEKTPKRVVQNYIGWRVTKSIMSYLTKEARDIKLKYDKVIQGKNALPPRWKTCVKAVGFSNYYDSNLRVAAATLYVKKHFPKEAKSEMLVMISYLRKAFAKILDDLDWMDNKTKEKARQKLTHIAAFIGYPDEILDQKIVEKYHEGVEISENDYFENRISLAKWNRAKKFKKLREKVDKNDWTHHSLVALVNAFYNPSLNSIEFPAGILQGVFFDHKVPKYLNYGAIGAVIGHEITHGFDDQGRQYDYDGNLADWWEPETKSEFIKKTECIINQYTSYKSNQIGLNVNGVTTQGENIADNGGTKEAYMAYEDWESDNNLEPMLPGLKLSSKQLFWVSWGQVWCVKYRDASLKQQIRTGAHSPGLYRIIGPLSNSPQFSRDFNCPQNIDMNPDQKCSVW